MIIHLRDRCDCGAHDREQRMAQAEAVLTKAEEILAQLEKTKDE